ncbi:MAG TPA: tetratricopeptide repeat protein, partial [Longimicrobiaceae bacterium]|nr:tetratricopeptide repeat protein [Longimicrobiaceae bacterium]
MSGDLETNPPPAPPRGETGEERGGGDASKRPAATQAGDGGADAAAVERIAEARSRRRFDRAAEEIEAALQRHPDSTGVLVQRAWLRREEGNPEGALSEFDAILRKEPNNEEALVGKAALLRARRSLDELEALLAHALKQHPDSVSLQNESGWFYLDTGRLDEAERVFGAVLGKEGENRDALHGTVAMLRKLRKFGDAQALLDRALRVHEHDRGLLCERAWVELEQDRLGPALAAFEAVLREDEAGKWFDDEHERHVAWKVFLQTELRDLDGAERTIRSALVHFRESALLRTDLGWVQFHRREYREALQTFESVPDTAPEQDSSLQGRIAALRAQGEFGAARRLADDAVLRLPKSAGIISERAWLALAMGDVTEARSE